MVEDVDPPPPASTPLVLVKPPMGLSKTKFVYHTAYFDFSVMLLGASL